MVLQLFRLHLRAMIRLRDLSVVAAAGLGLVLAGNFWFGAPFTPRGALGTWLLDTDGSLTYGLGIAFVGATVCVAATASLDENLHAGGLRYGDIFAARVLACAAIGLGVRALVIVVQLVAGLIDSLARSGHLIFGSPVPFDSSTATGQARVLLIYLLAAIAGGCLASAVGNRLGAISIATLSVGLYLPFMGSLFERAKTSLHVLAALPFGQIRAILSGNAGIFGQSSSYQRLLDPALAALLFMGWLLLFVAIALLRRARALSLKRSGPRRRIVFGIALASAVVLGISLPPALSSAVPWRWRPDWRQARDRGWASDQVAGKWLENVRGDTQVSGDLFSDPSVLHAVSPGRLQAIRESSSVRVQTESNMRDPFHVEVILHYRPPVQTSNLRVRTAWMGFSFKRSGERYVIADVTGPAIGDVEVLR